MNTTSIALLFIFNAGFVLPNGYSGHGLYPSRVPQTLKYAATYGKIDQVRRFLQSDAYTPAVLNDSLMRASQGGHVEVVGLLIGAGAHVDYEQDGWSLLMGAVANGHLQVAKILCRNGAHVLTGKQLSKIPEHACKWYKEISTHHNIAS